MLSGKTIVLGVTGSIAAYKAAYIASQLTQAGAKVNVVMTKAATEFVTPLTFRAVTGRPVVTEMFSLSSEFSIEHVSLAEAAEIVVIAPATANIIAKLATGLADDMLCCTVLATNAPVLVAPAMEANMYANPITQDNLSKLKARNFIVVEPASGRLASGKEGLGRLADINDIMGTICQVLGEHGDLAGKHTVITAGGTQEPIDPVRYITNRSSGKMGYALAEAARDRGSEVTLITAPTSLIKPKGVDVVNVTTAEEMCQTVEGIAPKADVLIMAAAVADYRSVSKSEDKIKKQEAGLTLELELTPDILCKVEGNFVRVGFAAESSDLVKNAKQKLQQKNLDLIVANDITASDSGFGADSNRVTIIDREGRADSLPLLPKREVADKVLDKVMELLAGKNGKDNGILITVQPAYIDHGYLGILKGYRSSLPGFKIPFKLDTGIDIIETHVDASDTKRWRVGDMNSGAGIQKGLGRWFDVHKLNPGDKVIIEVIEPMKRYRLKKV